MDVSLDGKVALVTGAGPNIGSGISLRAAAIELAAYGIRVNSFTPAAPAPDNPELIAQRAARASSTSGLGRPDPSTLPSWWRSCAPD